MKKFLPFVNKPQDEIEVIGNDNTGLLHLIKRHGITPNENPSDFQLQQKKQQKFLLKLTQRIKELAKEEGVPVAEMRKRVMGGTIAKAGESKIKDYALLVTDTRHLDNPPRNFEEAVLLYFDGRWKLSVFNEQGEWSDIDLFESEEVTPEQVAIGELLLLIDKEIKGFIQYPHFHKVSQSLKSRVLKQVSVLIDEPISAEVVDDDEQQMFDYLDEETAELLFNLQEDKARLAIRAATFMLQYRVVYPILVLNNTVAGSKTVNIESPLMTIDAGISIHFGGRKYLEVSQQLIPTFRHSEVLHVNETAFQLSENDTGFLCEPGKRELQKGYPDWTEDDTRTHLSEEMIALLFNFYQLEAGVIAEPPSDEDSENGDQEEGNLLSPSNDQSPTTSSTGQTSTIDSNGSEFEMSGSTTGILETSQAG